MRRKTKDMTNLKTKVFAIGFAGALALSAALVLAIGVFDRGLPTTNLNNAAGANRSNVTWSFGNDWLTGDDFTVGAAGEVWAVTGIRTWSTAGYANTGFHLGDEFDTVSLYGGPADPGGISLIASGALLAGSSQNSNSNITHTKVQYLGGLDYQGQSGAYYQIWQNDFENLTWLVSGGQKYNFAVDGTVRAGVSAFWFNHASNAALSGSTQDGTDGFYLGWYKAEPLVYPLGTQAPYRCDSGGACGGWDKSSDINVQVFASRVTQSGDICKNGGWASAVRSDGSLFKNQGDCLSYVRNGK
jgi:hypothetical protein